MRRIYQGPVTGGHPQRIIPQDPTKLDMAIPHAVGRVQAMAETLLHVAYVKSAGLVPTHGTVLTASGARFQDFRGTKDFVMAHRNIMAVNVAGKNIAEYANNLSDLRRRLIAPQARTDPLQPMANYADRLLEIAAADPALAVMQHVFDWQRANQPIEKSLIVDATFKLMEVLLSGHEAAAERHVDIMKRKGWVEIPIGRSIGEQGPAVPLSDSALLEELRTAGPMSGLVNERIEQMSFSLFQGNPSEFGDFPQIYLGVSQIHADAVTPKTVDREAIEQECAALDEARVSLITDT